MAAYRVKNWNDHFENNRTRELKRLDWVPVPNKMDGRGYTALVDHPNGASHLGGWLAILEIASRQKVRGEIPQDGAGLSQCLARISRLPVSLFEELIPRLESMGWIEGAEIPQLGATIPQDGAASRARIPFPSVPFNSFQEAEEIRKQKLTETLAIALASEENPLTVEELDTAWEMHHKPRGDQPRSLVFSHIVGMNGNFNLERFRQRHRIYCEYWDRRDWAFCPLSFLDWVEQGMPLPPPEPKKGKTAKRKDDGLDDFFKDAHDD